VARLPQIASAAVREGNCSMKKLAYLESLRGLAALAVVFNHFVIGFYPVLYFGASEPGHLPESMERVLSGTPLNLLYNGSFSVALFFVLSGFVLSYKFFHDRSLPAPFIGLTVKRYVRLLPPVVVSVLLSYLLLRSSLLFTGPAGILTGSTQFSGYLRFAPDLGAALHEAFVGALLRHHAAYNGVLWTMTFEFFGSLLVFLFVILFRNRRWRFLAYLLFLALFRSRYYTAFIVGAALCDLFTLRPDLFRDGRHVALSVLALAAGLFLGSYPAYRTTAGTIYAFLEPLAPAHAFHMAGAGLVMIALLSLPRLRSALSRRPFVFLGKISFSMYILHASLIASVGCALFLHLAPHLPYHAAVLATVLLTMPLIVAASALTYRAVDLPGVRLSQTVYAQAVAATLRIKDLLARLVPGPLRTSRLFSAFFAEQAGPGSGADAAAAGE
jgi:peptidoglycan/LPS O-acetylase OafA/YrhL